MINSIEGRKRGKNKQKGFKQKITRRMEGLNPNFPNDYIKQKLSKHPIKRDYQIKFLKHNPIICYPQDTFCTKTQVKVKGWKGKKRQHDCINI